MKLRVINSVINFTSYFILEIEDQDLAIARLTPDDRSMIHHLCREEGTIEEKLMGLSTLARRIEEAYNQLSLQTNARKEIGSGDSPEG